MGLKNWFVDQIATPMTVEMTITRAEFQQAIQLGLNRARRHYSPHVYREEHEAAFRALEEIGRTAKEADFNTWKNENSCGCPLVQTGVTLKSQLDLSMLAQFDKLPAIITNFTTPYDREMKRLARLKVGAGGYGIRGHATIID